jgi:outer membrane lipoprotein-sorting protein
MGSKGDLLEVIDGAPIGVHTLTGSVWKWTHYERSRRAHEALTSQSNVNISTFILSFGGPAEETTDEHLRIMVAPPDRWHIESENRVDVRDGHTRWVGPLTHITKRSFDDTNFNDTDIGLLVYPGAAQFLAALRFGDPFEDEVAGRHCWKVEATTELGRHAMRMFPVSMRLGGIDHTFWFDIATGIVLRHVGLVDHEPWSITEFKEVTINPPLTDFDFRFVAPPHAIIERQVDQLIRMADVRGVDLTGVDREDPHAVQEAMRNMMLPNQPTPERQLELRKAKHVPVADPPVDEATARESIVYAFNNLGEVDDEGTILVNVQSGRGLAGPLSEAQKRVPGAADNAASLIVDDVKFLRPDEAVVWFSVEVNGERFPMVNGREGRAVKVGERWLIEHATIADLLQFAGVVVPSPDE